MRADLRRPAIIAAAAVVAAIVLVTWKWIGDRDGSDGDGRASAQTAPIVVERYLSALQHKDRSALRELAPPGYDASGDVEDRLAKYGEIRQGANTSLTKDFAPDVLTLRIRAVGADGRPLRWTENLVRKAGGWFVLLGGAQPHGDARPSSSTAAPQ